VIAGYQLEEEVGHGGMAVVFRARDTRLNRQVALKVLSPALAKDEEFRRRFIRESQTAAAVDDANIIPVFEAGEADGVLYIAMRLVRGGDVKSLVTEHGQLSTGRVIWIVSAVASALDAAHAAGLVHRDVKPHNMLLETRPGRPDHVYLADFGLSKATVGSSGLTGLGRFIGTVDYCAPEQIQGKDVDGRTDQYALGCTAFELLCGQPPFTRPHEMAGLYAHVFEFPPLVSSCRSGLAPGVDEVFARVLAKDPAGRYRSCQEFASALAHALGVRPYAIDDSDDDLAAGAEAGDQADLGLPPSHPSHPSQLGETRSLRTIRSAPVGPSAPERPRDAAEPDTVFQPTEPNQPRPSREPDQADGRRRIAIIAGAGAGALVAAGVVAGLLLVKTPAANHGPAEVTRVFAAQHLPGGVLAVRRWKLSGHGGSTLTGEVTLTNPTGSARYVQYDEPVPAAIASSLTLVRFSPAATVVDSGRAAQWRIHLPAHGQAQVSYNVAVPAAGLTPSRLAAWANDLDALAAGLRSGASSPAVRSLSLTPRALALAKGATARLKVSGVLSDHKTAAPAQLAKVTWSSADPAVATVSQFGKVTAKSVGKALVTVRLGSASASAKVTVTAKARSNPGTSPTLPAYTAPGYTPPASTSPPYTPPPSSSPNPTPTVTPTQLIQPARVNARTTASHRHRKRHRLLGASLD
jgi:serine/threonine-protein kinase